MKYSKHKNIAKHFENVPDPYLVAIEYGGISYILDAYFPTRDKATHALQLTAVLLLYEHLVMNYGPKTTTKINGTY